MTIGLAKHLYFLQNNPKLGRGLIQKDAMLELGYGVSEVRQLGGDGSRQLLLPAWSCVLCHVYARSRLSYTRYEYKYVQTPQGTEAFLGYLAKDGFRCITRE